MRLLKKLLVYIIFGVLIGVGFVQLIQYFSLSSSIQDLSDSNIALLRTIQQENARNIYTSVEQSLAGSLKRGEMKKFNDLLKLQKEVEGLLEFSLYDRRGVVSHSTDQAFLNKKLPKELADDLLSNPEQKFMHTEDAIEIYQPERITPDCIRCHVDWMEGGIGGVTYFKFSNEAMKNAQVNVEEAISGTRGSMFFMSFLGILLIVGIVVGLLFYLFKKFITAPLQDGVELAAAVAEGNLNYEITSYQDDEIGDLVNALNDMSIQLRNLIHSIVTNSDKVSNMASGLDQLSNKMMQSANTLHEKSDSVSDASKQMSNNMTEISSTADKSSSSTQMVAASSEEMSTTIHEISENTSFALRTVMQAVESVTNATRQVNELNTAANEIGNVVEIIIDIADQTKLLALNATIEAARAGDAGKGFAVVASEVKDLATQTNTASIDIKKRIDAIQASTSGTISDMQQIDEVINKVNEMVNMIASAVEEQSVTTKDISQNINQTASSIGFMTSGVSQAAQASIDIAKEVGSVNEASTEVDKLSREVNHNSNDLMSISKELNALISHFKLNGN